MKYLALLILAISPALYAATDAQMTAYCELRAIVFYDVAMDRDNGFTIANTLADVRAVVATASNPDSATFYATNGEQAVKAVYNQPTVQPQVWFGYELALCEVSPPASSLIITAAPK